MIGNGYWSTGITVFWRYAGGGDYGWAGTLDYQDAGFCDDDADQGRVSTEGKLHTRYAVRPGEEADALAVIIDVLKADAERLGIRFGVDGSPGPYLYYKGDGEDEDYPPPDGWQEMLGKQADRLGWKSLYRAPEQAG